MISEFINEYAFLSNFYPCKIITPDLLSWSTAEHLFQAYKTLDTFERHCINVASTPGIAKRLGKRCTLRSNWEEIKFDVMTYVVRIKFYQNPNLIAPLILTKDQYLQEGNVWHDNIWGVCSCNICQRKGNATNLLGKILMNIRSELMAYSEFIN